MSQRLTSAQRTVLMIGRPDLAAVWDLALAVRLDELTAKQQAELRLGHCILQSRSGQHHPAAKAAQAVITMAEGAGWPDLAAGGYAARATFEIAIGRYDLAQADAQAAVALAPHSVPAALGLNALGRCASQSAEMDVEAASGYFQQAAELSRALDYPFGLAMALSFRGQHVHGVRGELDLMVANCDAAAAILAQLEYPYSEHYYVRAYAHYLRGERDQLQALLDRLRAIVPESAYVAAAYANYTALLAMDQEDYPLAAQGLARLREIVSATGRLECELWVRLTSSRYHMCIGELQTALAWARDGVALAQQKGAPTFELPSQITGARVALELDDAPACRAYLSAAEAIANRLGAQVELALLGLLRAILDAREQRPEAAASWLAAAQRIQSGGYGFLLERERALAFPLVAAYARSRDRILRSSTENLLDQLAHIAPLPLHVQGLGRFEVRQGRRPSPPRGWQQRRAGELFRFLLLQPGYSASREVIFEALCPSQPAESAQTFLHHATSSLRRLLEPDLPAKFTSRYVLVEGDQLALRLPSGSSVDFAEFEQQVGALLAVEGAPRARPQPAPAELARVLALYTGDLFRTEPQAEWAMATGERLAELHRRGLLALAQQYLAVGQPQSALDTCRALLAADPWREAAVLTGMQACLALHDRPAALRLYQRLEQSLRAELHLAPRADLAALAASLQDS